MKQMQHEAPVMFKALTSEGIINETGINDQIQEAQAQEYDPRLSSYYLKGVDVAQGTIDKLGKTNAQFMQEAHAYIKDYGAKRYGSLGFKVSEPELYSALVASPQ